MLIETIRTPLKKVRLTNYTTNGFPSFVAQNAKPNITDDLSATAQEAIELTQEIGGASQNGVLLVPYGVGNDDATFTMRVIGWEIAGPSNRDTALWIPVKLGEFTCTLGTTVGVAGMTLLATERFCDTIALVGTSGHDGVNCDIFSPADNTIAHVLVDLKGCSLLEVVFTTGGSATSTNALYSLM